MLHDTDKAELPTSTKEVMFGGQYVTNGEVVSTEEKLQYVKLGLVVCYNESDHSFSF